MEEETVRTRACLTNIYLLRVPWYKIKLIFDSSTEKLHVSNALQARCTQLVDFGMVVRVLSSFIGSRVV